MNTTLPPGEPSTAVLAQAELELTRLTGSVEAMRTVLIRLLQDVISVEGGGAQTVAAHIVEANEQLVQAAIRSRAEASAATSARDEVLRTAQLDTLTQLPNRSLLLDRHAQAIAAARRNGTQVALLFVDIDNFKQVNDTLGHAAGDLVLVQIAQRLRDSLRAIDTVSRHGGDEFLILLTELTQAQDAAQAARTLLTALTQPLVVHAQTLHMSASIGISVFPQDGSEVDTLIGLADEAMYAAKRKGHGGIGFASDIPSTELPLMPQEDPQSAARLMALRHAQLREANEHLVLAAISAQELQAAAEMAQARQRLFIAAVAEELRNPTAPIRITTAVLGRTDIDGELMPRVQYMVEQHLAQLATLVGSRLESPPTAQLDAAITHTPVNMVAVVRTAIAAFRPTLDARHQQFAATVPNGPLIVDGNEPQLLQIASNLLENASKHTHDGGNIQLIMAVSDDDQSLTISISDDGIGIEPETLPRVFEPFVQDPQAFGFHGVDLGIGLTVVRALMQAHGGSVVADSAGCGKGSQFVATFPLDTPPLPTARSVSLAPTAANDD